MRLAYDVSNYTEFSVSSAGLLSIDSTGAGAGVNFVDGVRERNRTVPMGEWAAHAFNAGDFTQGSGTWTVGSGDVAVNRYTIVGKTYTWTFTLTGTTTASTPSSLRILLPAGVTAAAGVRGGACGATVNNGVTIEPGYWSIASSGTYVSLFRFDTGNWDDGTDNTSISCTISFESV